MSRLSKLSKENKLFIPFIVCGDPDLETTKEIVLSCVKAGADAIELGIPFSDPMAEGPVIMNAYDRAIKSGTTTTKVIEMVSELRSQTDIPLVFMTYANVVYAYKSGIEEFVKEAAAAGIDALILPDVSFEEKAEFSDICDKYDVDFISLIAPSSGDRIEMIAKEAKGFLYCVSSPGVTGVRKNIDTDIDSMIKRARSVSQITCAIGFGISTPEQAKDMAHKADGVIVGSSIVSLCEEHGKKAPDKIFEYVSAMKAVLN